MLCQYKKKGAPFDFNDRDRCLSILNLIYHPLTAHQFIQLFTAPYPFVQNNHSSCCPFQQVTELQSYTSYSHTVSIPVYLQLGLNTKCHHFHSFRGVAWKLIWVYSFPLFFQYPIYSNPSSLGNIPHYIVHTFTLQQFRKTHFYLLETRVHTFKPTDRQSMDKNQQILRLKLECN